MPPCDGLAGLGPDNRYSFGQSAVRSHGSSPRMARPLTPAKPRRASMNEHLRERILRKVDALSDERGYQVLDYVEFLESKFAERQSPQGNAFTRFTEAVEDRLRAGKVSASAIAET